MIPKADILNLAKEDRLRDTTVQKDYALGWLLYGIAEHPRLSRWVFKGGTCLKKCFFETYRFSEDLDFTIPSSEALNEEVIRQSLIDVSNWVHEESGIVIPTERIKVEGYSNKQDTESFQAKLFYSGPLRLPRSSQPRIKFDITQHEVLVDPPDHRAVFHGYRDALEPAPRVACYSVNEVLAEKTRALYERRGRARDVYDVVHISRNFREEIPRRLRSALRQRNSRSKGSSSRHRSRSSMESTRRGSRRTGINSCGTNFRTCRDWVHSWPSSSTRSHGGCSLNSPNRPRPDSQRSLPSRCCLGLTFGALGPGSGRAPSGCRTRSDSRRETVYWRESRITAVNGRLSPTPSGRRGPATFCCTGTRSTRQGFRRVGSRRTRSRRLWVPTCSMVHSPRGGQWSCSGAYLLGAGGSIGSIHYLPDEAPDLSRPTWARSGPGDLAEHAIEVGLAPLVEVHGEAPEGLG